MGSKLWVPAASGPLAPYAPGFCLWLRSRSYSPSAAANRLWQLDQLSRWLHTRGLTVGELTPACAAEFATSHRVRRAWCHGHRSALLELPLGASARAWRRAGTVSGGRRGSARAGVGRVPPLSADRAAGCLSTRSAAMCRSRGSSLRASRVLTGARSVSVGGGRMSGFLAAECPKRSVSGARDLASALRSLLRFLHVTGLIELPLVWAVPPVADWRDRCAAAWS